MRTPPSARKKGSKKSKAQANETRVVDGVPGIDIHAWFNAMERVVRERSDQRAKVEEAGEAGTAKAES